MNNHAGFIYEWTNKLNGMRYIGAHTGQDSDGYIGSGKKFREELRNHGLDNFERKILEYVSDTAKIKDRENYYLDLVDAANNKQYYNTSRKSSGLRNSKPITQPARSLCCACQQRPVAVNYTRDTITHYRTRCDACLKRKKNPKPYQPRWQASGYKKKMTCDRCGFRAQYTAQMLVYHVDGNLANSSVKNLKSICKNCEITINKSTLPWKPGDLSVDV
jgi:hypothetical protein